MNQVVVGNTANTRVGQSIKIKSFNMRANAGINSSGRITVLRCMVFVDKQQAADATPTIAVLLDSATPESPINLFSQKRFRVLYDKYITLNDSGHNNYGIDISIPLDMVQLYNGSAATDIDKNGIFMLLIASEVTNDPVFIHTSWITYRDN